jgi:S-adenosylmethionine hydrolase
MIVLFTDFGADDIYVGQVKAALLAHLPAGAVIIDLLHSVPNFHVRAGAHLLAALRSQCLRPRRLLSACLRTFRLTR